MPRQRTSHVFSNAGMLLLLYVGALGASSVSVCAWSFGVGDKSTRAQAATVKIRMRCDVQALAGRRGQQGLLWCNNLAFLGQIRVLQSLLWLVQASKTRSSKPGGITRTRMHRQCIRPIQMHRVPGARTDPLFLAPLFDASASCQPARVSDACWLAATDKTAKWCSSWAIIVRATNLNVQADHWVGWPRLSAVACVCLCAPGRQKTRSGEVLSVGALP